MANEQETEKTETPTALVKSEDTGGLATAKNTDELPLTVAAKALKASGLVKPNETLGNVVAKMSLGRNLGIPDIASLTGINITEKGGILVSAAVLHLLIKVSKKYKIKVRQRDEKGASIEVFERDPINNEWESCGVPVSFGPNDAKRAGLDGRETYKKWPIDMYFNRALAAAFRTYCADCMLGVPMYLPEEIDKSGYKTDIMTGDMVTEADYEVKQKPTKANGVEKDIVSRIHNLMTETNSDLEKFLKHFETDSIDKLSVEQRQELEEMLKKKKKVVKT